MRLHRNQRVGGIGFMKALLVGGAIATGCGGALHSWEPRYETLGMPSEGSACPNVGTSLQAYAGQEVGSGPGARPLYLATITRADGNDIAFDLRMPLSAPSASQSQVSWLVTFTGAGSDEDRLPLALTAVCGMGQTRAAGDSGAARPAQDASPVGGEGGEAGAPQAPPPRPQVLETPEGSRFPPDSSAEFARQLADNLGKAVPAFLSLVRGERPREGEAAELTVAGSDRRGFTIRVSGGRFSGETVAMSRLVELQWDLTRPQAESLRIPYRIRTMGVSGGRLEAVVAVDCSRDMVVVGHDLEARAGPHPSCGGSESEEAGSPATAEAAPAASPSGSGQPAAGPSAGSGGAEGGATDGGTRPADGGNDDDIAARMRQAFPQSQ